MSPKVDPAQLIEPAPGTTRGDSAAAVSTTSGGERLGRILHGLLWSGLAALAAAIAVGLWADWRNLAAAFGHFSWTAFPIALGLTLVNASLRFVKWHYYCHRVGARPTLRDSALIFVGGFALSVTPGKTGEFLKAYLLSRRCGAAAWKAAPITLAERTTDGFAIVVLAGIGLSVVWHSIVPVALCVVAAAGGAVGLSLLATSFAPGRRRAAPRWLARPWLIRWRSRLEERPLFGRVLHRLEESGAGAAVLLDPRSMAFAVALGVVSWSAESFALWNALIAFGMPATTQLLGSALVALNAGTLVGAASLLPGGAGAAEATIAAVLVQQTSREVAAAATLLIRLCTIWFGAILGIGALLALRDSLGPERRSASPSGRGRP